MFQLKVEEGKSIGDLTAMVRGGQSVVRSSHAGNQYGSNMALLAAGIPAIQYDRTIGRKDRNYHPHHILRGGESMLKGVLCSPDILVARTTAGSDHLRVLRRVFPRVRVELYGDYILRHASDDRYILPMLRQVSHTLGGKTWRWHRFVEDSGEIRERHPANWAQIEAEGIFGVTRETHGWIMPNNFNVLLITLFEALEYGTNIVHHLSGPDMITYIGKMAPEISPLWDDIARYAGAPTDITFSLYPTASARLVTLAPRRAQLDELINAYEALDQHRQGKGQKIKEVAGSERQELIKRLSQNEQGLRDRVKRALLHCDEPFIDIKSGRHLTHHDAARHGLYVPRWTIEQPLARQAKVFKDLQKLHGQPLRRAA